MRVFLMLGALMLAAAPAVAAEAPVRPRLCPEDLPEGVRLPPSPGCAAAAATVRRRDDGFRDLGGVSVRVTGRAAAEFGARR